MEKEGFIRGMEIFNKFELPIKTLVTDQHTGLAKYIKENLSHLNHRYDVWHVAKSKPASNYIYIYTYQHIQVSSSKYNAYKNRISID